MFVSLFYNCGQVDFPVDELIPKVTRPLYECLKILNKRPALSCHCCTYATIPCLPVDKKLRYSFQLSKNFQRKYEWHIICLTFSERVLFPRRKIHATPARYNSDGKHSILNQMPPSKISVGGNNTRQYISCCEQ